MRRLCAVLGPVLALTCVFVCLVMASGAADQSGLTATTIVLQQGIAGYEGCQDTYIYRDAPGARYCGSSEFWVGYRQKNVGLLCFDLSPIPAGASVISASLELRPVAGSDLNVSVRLYRVLQNWSACAASWNHPWNLAGCGGIGSDHVVTETSQAAAAGSGGWYTFDVGSAVQSWISGQANYGIVLIADYSNGLLRLASADSSDPRVRPKLTVTYAAAIEQTPTSSATLAPTSTRTRTPTATITQTPTRVPSPVIVRTDLGPTASANWFQIAVVSDIHIGEDDRDKDYGSPGWEGRAPGQDAEGAIARALRDLVSWVNENCSSERVKYVFVTGDLTASAELSELEKAKEILDLLMVPYVPLIGNHDVWPYVRDGESQASEEQSDHYFDSVFSPVYERLRNDPDVLNLQRCPVPVWNFEVSNNHYSYFQDLIFDSDVGNWRFLCLDTNTRNAAGVQCLSAESQECLYGGVCPQGDLYPLSIDRDASSIRVHDVDSRGIVLYEEPYFEGRSETFLADDDDLSVGNFLHAQEASSVRVVGACSVTLYSQAAYAGECITLTESCPDLRKYSFENRASSLRVSGAYTGSRAVLFSGEGYEGLSETFIVDDDDLSDNAIRNDTARSVRAFGNCWAELFGERKYNYGPAGLTASYSKVEIRPSMPSPADDGNPDLAENGAYRWWHDQLKQARADDKIVILAHHPLFWAPSTKDTTPADLLVMAASFKKDEYDQVVSALRDSKATVFAWFAGHVHDLGWPRDQWSIMENADGTEMRGYFVDSFKSHLENERGLVRLVKLHY